MGPKEERGAVEDAMMGCRTRAFWIPCLAFFCGLALVRSEAEPSPETLRPRLRNYCAALEEGDFGAAWEFFAATMKRDTPKQEFVKMLKATLKRFKVAGPAKIEIESVMIGGQKKTLGKTSASILITEMESKTPVQQTLRTTWVWELAAGAESPAWYLTGSRVGPDSAGEVPRDLHRGNRN